MKKISICCVSVMLFAACGAGPNAQAKSADDNVPGNGNSSPPSSVQAEKPLTQEGIQKEKMLFTYDEVWVSVDGGVATIGMTDCHADMGEIYATTILKSAADNDTVYDGETFFVVHAENDAYEYQSPADGEVVEENEALRWDPQLILKDPYGKGWIIKVKTSRALNPSVFMDWGKYQEHCKK